MSSSKFAEHGDLIFKRAHGLSHVVRKRRFSDLFGVTPEACERVWQMIYEKVPRNAQWKHLLWAMIFLKICATEHVNSIIISADKNIPEVGSDYFGFTVKPQFGNVSLYYVYFNYLLSIGTLETRLCVKQIKGCHISVDGTNCPVYENHPFDQSLFLHKFKRAGLRYELAVCVYSGKIARCHGPFICENYPDLSIYQTEAKEIATQQ